MNLLRDRVRRGIFQTPSAVRGHRWQSSMTVFDRNVKHMQRQHAFRPSHAAQSRVTDYLREEVAERVADRLLDIKRTFPRVLDLGSGYGAMGKYMDPETVQELVQLEYSQHMLQRDQDQEAPPVPVTHVCADEEGPLPFPENSMDAVVSSMSMHWINDLPGTFQRVKHILKPDAPFLGAMLAGDTLFELRCAFQLAEQEREGGLSPHVSPFATAPDVSGLLNLAGFTLTTMDMDEIVVNYPSVFELMHDLQAMAENNAVLMRKTTIPKDTLLAMAAIYKEMYGNEDGTIPATFQILYLIGWKPDPSQPKPIRRGSGKVSIKDLDKLTSAGSPSPPPPPFTTNSS